MNIIYKNERKIKSYLPHELNTRYYVVLSYISDNKATHVCRKYYQYTCIDEASRKRFIYHYEEHNKKINSIILN